MTDYSIFGVDAAALQSHGWGEGGWDVEVLTLGTEFSTLTDAWITHFRYPHVLTNGKPSRKTMALYEVPTGLMVAGPVLMPAGTPGQWNTAPLPAPFKLATGTGYRVAVFYPDGGYPASPQYFREEYWGASQAFGPLIVPAGAGNFGYDTAIKFPDGSFNSSGYYSDVIATDTDPTVIPGPPDAIFAHDNTPLRAYTLAGGALTELSLTP